MGRKIAAFAIALTVLLLTVLPMCLLFPFLCLAPFGGGGDVKVTAVALDVTPTLVEPARFNDTRAAENRHIRTAVERAVATPSELIFVRVDGSRERSLRRALEPLPRSAIRGHRGAIVTYRGWTVVINLRVEQ